MLKGGEYMVTTEEKKELIKTIVESIFSKGNIEDLQFKIHKTLLKDTLGGKLYKFRTFDKKGRALKSLKQGTLFCANPETFNDPYDCKIGITLMDFYGKIKPDESNLLKSIIEKFPLVADDELALDDCTEEEKIVIEKLLQNKSLMQKLKEENSAFTSPNNSYHEQDIEKPSIITEIIREIISTDKFEETLGPYVDDICKLVDGLTPNKISSLPDGLESHEVIAKINGIEDDNDEIDTIISLTKGILPQYYLQTNKSIGFIEDIDRKMTREMGRSFRACCLCTDYKNRLMWSHYADSHKGFCIEYDFSGNDLIAFKHLPFPIYYSKDRPTIPWEDCVNITPESSKSAASKLMIGMLTKDAAWNYENEWRILISSNESANIKMPKISCVYLGVSISPINKAKIIAIAKRNHFSVKQMKVDRGKYKLRTEDVYIDKN